MPQLGFSNARRGNLSVKGKELESSGIVILVGIVGVLKGNVAYTIDIENAKKIASTMMMGMPINKIDAMAKSALAELTNMLAANAATCFSKMDVLVDISTPVLLQGEDLSVQMSADQVLCLSLLTDEVQMEVNIAFEAK